jgi:hypothetical protein
MRRWIRAESRTEENSVLLLLSILFAFMSVSLNGIIPASSKLPVAFSRQRIQLRGERSIGRRLARLPMCKYQFVLIY